MRTGRRTVGGQEKVSGILSFAPFDLVDLLFDFERLEVIEFWFVGLELGVKLVLAALLLAGDGDGDKRWHDEWAATRTWSFRSKRTTRPPLSPVAR